MMQLTMFQRRLCFVAGLIVLGFVISSSGLPAPANDATLNGRFLASIDEQIGKLAPQYPQLAAWNQVKATNEFTVPGKLITREELTYTQAMRRVHSSDYRDWYGRNGCSIRITLIAEADYEKLGSGAVKMGVFGEKLGDRRIVATVITEHPENLNLEQTINNLIRETAARVQK
ncbi:MAG TPA: hypothetical protein VGK40_11695 [Verrucomicrobiae bacterium]|jgi:hypothetical protein